MPARSRRFAIRFPDWRDGTRVSADFGGGITYLDGGVESGFRHVEKEAHTVRLLHVKGRAGSILLKEVPLSRASMNSGDVFILDAEESIYQARKPLLSSTLHLEPDSPSLPPPRSHPRLAPNPSSLPVEWRLE